jgi:hypothetical protein
MTMKQMLRTIDSEELALQMAYDLCEAEDHAAMRGDAAPASPIDLPTAPAGALIPLSPERLAAKLEQLWGEAAS